MRHANPQADESLSQVVEERTSIVERFGEWTAHNLQLRDSVYTFPSEHPNFEGQLTGHGIHLRRIVQSVSDMTARPLSSLRVLDLACLEGLYGLEFARHGAEVVLIEGREASLEKARFAGKTLGLTNVTFIQDDVRNISLETLGSFDVILCLGLLYHLEAPAIFTFVERLASMCRLVSVIDTHVGLRANASSTYRGQTYHGWLYTEHEPSSSARERARRLWASLDNEKSFWLTMPSLYNLLCAVGFTSVYDCANPAVPSGYDDRRTVVAIKGVRQELLSTPIVNHRSDETWPESMVNGVHPAQANYLDRLTLRARRLLERLPKRSRQ